MCMPYGIFCGLAQEIPRQQAAEDLRALTIAHTADPKDLAARLRAVAYPRNTCYRLNGKALEANWRGFIQAAGRSR